MSTSDFTSLPSIVTDLLALNAHLVPLNGYYSRPLPQDEAIYDRWKIPTLSWKERERCNAAVVERVSLGHWFGLIPSSLGFVVIDVDEGDIGLLQGALDSADYGYGLVKTLNGHHVFLRAGSDWPSGNWKWSAHGCAGDIRYDVGYVVVWDPEALLALTELSHEGAADKALANSLRPLDSKKKMRWMFQEL